MAEEKPKYDPKAKRKIRAESYEGKVKFDGTLEQMIAIAVKPPRPRKNHNKSSK